MRPAMIPQSPPSVMPLSWMLCASMLWMSAGAACAQVRGPVMGYLAEGGALRTMNGIPAAGSLSSPFMDDQGFSRIEVSPNQTQALALAADTGAVMLLTIATGSSVPIEGTASAPDRLVFSPSGTAAGLWFSATRRLQMISGLSAIPSVREIDFSFAGSDPAALAVSDDGEWMAGAWPFSLYAVGPAGTAIVLPVPGAAEAVSFFHGLNDLAVLTPRQAMIVTGIGGAMEAKVIWNKPDDPPPADAAAAPQAELAVGLAASFDNRYLSVAGDRGSLSTFDLAGGTSVGGNCSCSPAGLFGMGGSLYRLTAEVDGAAKIFDASSNEVWFVPLAPPQPQGRAVRPNRPGVSGASGAGQ